MTMTKTLSRIAAAALTLVAAVSCARAASDQFGVSQLYPTVSGGKEWDSKWTGMARTFTGVDPQDPWFDAAHGAATYTVDGQGLFKITGSTPRMYIHDPAKVQEWHDVEMTVYAMRVADDGTAFAGIVGVTRSNHGTTGPELANLCDTRGYGARARFDGTVDFDKETSHPNATAAASKPMFSGGLPKNVWIGYKHVTYDMANGHVMNELWLDQTDGANGGAWVKVNSFEDTGANFGVGAVACKSGINPALMLTNSDARPGSESGKPNITVYWRSTNIGTNGLVYKKMSVREIVAGAAPPPPPPVASAPVIGSVAASALAQNSATIGWTTDKASLSQVEYGLSASYGSTSAQSTISGTSHSVALIALTAGTAYHYRVKSLDSTTGLTGVSADNTFTTAAAPVAAAPVVSNVVVAAAASGAGISWTTDKLAHSQVEYGLTSAYGTLSYESGATGTSHNLALSGLTSGTAYHYRVKSLDSTTGLTGVSGDLTFTTTGSVLPPPPPPPSVGISAVNPSPSATGANITWNTTTASHSQVEYGLTASYGSLSYESVATGTSHNLVLTGLKGGSLHHYRVKSLDASGQTAVSGDFTFTTTGAVTSTGK